MARLTSPTGITVNVSDEKAAQLTSVGYVAEGEKSAGEKPAQKRTAKKATAKQSSDDK